MEIRSYADLHAWQKARALVRDIYELTATFPSHGVFGLTHQLRRSAVSVPSNIAEGYGRGSRKDYLNFLHMARGSLYELETQVVLAEDLGYLRREASSRLRVGLAEKGRLLQGLIRSLKVAPERQTTPTAGKDGRHRRIPNP